MLLVSLKSMENAGRKHAKKKILAKKTKFVSMKRMVLDVRKNLQESNLSKRH